ncbi:MAG: urease accessory protein UreE [Planctomycetota bacterium]|jgi:urease accessory protein UreE|nr:urease accessory protein UreE [Planctomycetota bacterium]
MLEFRKNLGVVAAPDAIALPLDYQERSRRRGRVKTADGQEVAIILSQQPQELKEGDILVAPSGEQARVICRPEEVVRAESPDPKILLRAAWLAGNQHVGLETGGDWIKIKPDPILERFFYDLDLSVKHEKSIFSPVEGGAHYHPSPDQPNSADNSGQKGTNSFPSRPWEDD